MKNNIIMISICTSLFLGCGAEDTAGVQKNVLKKTEDKGKPQKIKVPITKKSTPSSDVEELPKDYKVEQKSSEELKSETSTQAQVTEEEVTTEPLPTKSAEELASENGSSKNSSNQKSEEELASETAGNNMPVEK